VSPERVGITEAVAITGLGARKLRELAPKIPGTCKELSETNTPVWRFDEELLRGWVAGTVETVQSDARRKALSGRFPCDFYMRGPFMAAWEGHPNRVYFIGSESAHVKIGLAFKPAQRLKDLQCASPFELTLLAERPGSRAVEMYLHEFYDQERVRGEWFNRSERLMAYIEKLRG
jgi:hypothetical protein